MATGDIKNPFGNYSFLVEIDGITRAAFHEASGFDSTIDVIPYREGGDNTTTRKIPGVANFSNVVLKRGITDDVELHRWHRQWASGDPTAKRVNGSIVLVDRSSTEVARWNFSRAWPAKWTGPSFNAEGKDIAIETLELCHEGIDRV